MTHIHIVLALASVALLGVVAAQDYFYKPLRQESISAGLTGPYHWYLDASYVVLAVALVTAFRGTVGEWFAVISAVALLLTAVTNTFGTWVDTFTDGQHELWHTRFSTVVFVAALVLECVMNRSWPMWIITAVNVIAPASIYLLSGNNPNTEKVGVSVLCLWLVAWALT